MVLARFPGTPALQRLFRQSPGGARPGRLAASDHVENRSIYNTQSARPTGIRRVCAAELGQAAARLYAAAEELAGLAREYRDAAEEAARAGG
jgi:hypothetical protein